MAIAQAKISLTYKFSWTPTSGDSITATASESFVQVGAAAIERSVNVTNTTAKLDLGDVTGDKYLFVKNTDANNTVYLDQVTPVVPSAAPIKIPPGKSAPIFTAGDNWYAITGAGTAQIILAAVNP